MKDFGDSHCKAGPTGSFGHVEFSGATELAASGGLTKLHTVFSGVEVEFQSTELTGTGEMENMLAESGEHTANGTGVIEYKNVTVTKPAGKGCIVKGGEVKTNNLKATTAGQGMGLLFEPSGGTVFAALTVENCSSGFLNGKYEIKGAVSGTPEGATAVFTASGTTAQKTLTIAGGSVGIDGIVTFSGRAKGSKSAYTALSSTTKATDEKAETEEEAKTKEEAETEEAETEAEEEAASAFGTTAFTCAPDAQPNSDAGFAGGHCRIGDGVETNAAFKHTEITQDTTTDLAVTNAGTAGETATSTPSKIHSVISGVEVEIQATGVTGTGTVTNVLSGIEHVTEGTGTLEFKGVTVLKPSGKSCVVKTGEIKTKELKATTAKQGMGLKVQPKEGTLFAEFNIEGCTIAALNGKYEAKGSVVAAPSRGTTEFTGAATTEPSTLTLRGQKAGIDGALTFSGRTKGSEGGYTPLSPTTMNT